MHPVYIKVKGDGLPRLLRPSHHSPSCVRQVADYTKAKSKEEKEKAEEKGKEERRGMMLVMMMMMMVKDDREDDKGQIQKDEAHFQAVQSSERPALIGCRKT